MENMIQLLLLDSSLLQRIERGVQYTESQSDSVQLTVLKENNYFMNLF